MMKKLLCLMFALFAITAISYAQPGCSVPWKFDSYTASINDPGTQSYVLKSAGQSQSVTFYVTVTNNINRSVKINGTTVAVGNSIVLTQSFTNSGSCGSPDVDMTSNQSFTIERTSQLNQPASGTILVTLTSVTGGSVGSPSSFTFTLY